MIKRGKKLALWSFIKIKTDGSEWYCPSCNKKNYGLVNECFWCHYEYQEIIPGTYRVCKIGFLRHWKEGRKNVQEEVCCLQESR